MEELVRGIREDGFSLIMMGGDACWGGGQEGAAFYKSWGETILDEVLPFESLGGTNPSVAAFNAPKFLDPEHPLVAGLRQCCRDWDLPAEVDAMTASCDSWMYNNQLGIPTIVYGPGTLGYAHTNEEQIALSQIAEAGCVLTDFALKKGWMMKDEG